MKRSKIYGERRIFLRHVSSCVAAVSVAGSVGAKDTRMPAKVACLDWGLAESMIVLGQVPLGVVAAADWPRFVVEPPLPVEVIDLGLQQELNFELLASLRPELILTSPFLQHLEPQLRRIAETLNLSVYDDAGTPLAQRENVLLTLGEALDADVAASRYLERAAASLDDAKRLIQGGSRRPMVLATFIDGRHVRVYGGTSLYQDVLARLNIANGWKESTGYFGFATVGIEKLAGLGDIDFIAFDPVPPDALLTLRESPLWRELPFVRAGRVTTLSPVLMFGGLPSALRLAHLLAERFGSERS